MSEREPWMPDSNAIKRTIEEWYEEITTSRQHDGEIEPFRALIRTAVERALAEQERKVRRATLQEAARAVCRRCSSDVPIREISWYYHGDGIGCDASSIHDLIAALEEGS